MRMKTNNTNKKIQKINPLASIHNLCRDKGFTLVETLVAISILSLSILATFTAVQSGLQDSTIVKDRITAFYLNQEGMEIIKNLRDENALNNLSGGGTNWLHGMAELLGDPCYFGKTCKVVSPALLANVTYCGVAFGSCPVLNQDSATGLFGYTSGGTWSATIFKREIQFTKNSDDEVLVTIQISWTTRGVAKSFKVTESLFNRQ